MKNILIVGGTGTLGKELVAQWLEKGEKVHILTRDPAKNAPLSNLGVIIIKGDLTDKTSLMSACKGMDAVVSAAHSLMGKGKYASEKVDDTGQKNLIDAAKEAGIKHFIFTSVIGASENHRADFWRRKWQIEQYLLASRLNYNIVRASAFMEFHIAEMLGKSIMTKSKATIFGKGQNPTNFVSVKDVAALMCQLLDTPQYQNQIFEIGSPDNPSRLDIVKLYEEKTGKSVKITHIPNGVLRFMSKLLTPFHPGLSRVMAVSDLFDRTEQTLDVSPLLKKIPLQLTSVSEFIKHS